MPCVLAVLVGVLAGTSLSAHRRDEYLQAARLAVEPRRVELHVDLTPGIEVADSILGDLDRDHDGRLSAGEKQLYVASVLSGLELRVDGRSLQVDPVAATFPELDGFLGGVGTIRLRTTTRLPRLSNGDHELSFHNRHRPDVSVYLANALVPDGDSIGIIAQRRDAAQRDLTVVYTVRDPGGASTPLLLMGVLGGMLLVALRTRR